MEEFFKRAITSARNIMETNPEKTEACEDAIGKALRLLTYYANPGRDRPPNFYHDVIQAVAAFTSCGVLPAE